MAHGHYQHHNHPRQHVRVQNPTYIQESPDYSFHVKRSGSSSACNAKDTQGCSYPTNNSPTLPIVLGVLIPLGAALVAIVILHRRNQKRQRFEDANDKHASLDFGLGEISRGAVGKKGRGKKSKQQPEMMNLNAEKEFRLGRGMSMDMGSPYVLPGEMASSRSSFHSLSRTATDQEDPYRPVAMLTSGDGASSRSPSRVADRTDASSAWTQGSDDTSRHLMRPTPALSSPSGLQELPTLDIPRAISPIQPPQPALTINRNSVEQDPALSAPPTPEIRETEGLLGDSDNSAIRTSYPKRYSSVAAPKHDFDFDVAPNNLQDGPQNNLQREAQHDSQQYGYNGYQNSPSIEVTASDNDGYAAQQSRNPMSDRYDSIPEEQYSHSYSNNNPTISVGAYDEDYETYADVLGIVQKESSDPLPLADDQHVGLGVYSFEQDNRRLSTSLRPLPPDDPTDNPETRANRIRSFYREYFDEAKGGSGGGGYYDGDYYEDYGQEYLNEATVFDPETGQFIVAGNAPYAEPVTRRAMTPPPRAPPRFGGPGSQGGPRKFGPGGHRPRIHSSASAGGFRGRARKPMAPPAPLTNLPTPHLLKDDTAIFLATDFAPPSLVRDRVAGRPDSPFAEQRPYSPTVRPYTPLVSPFDDLSAMPSPHHLRRSGTFTGLDFAPPPRLKADGASDAGSIRSGRSNMSASQLANIRAGAYRLSRIPKQTVGTRDDLAQALKPTWDQRGPSQMK